MNTKLKYGDTYWICLQTVLGKELQVEQTMEQSVNVVYTPRKYTDIRTKRRRQMVVEALFPCYMFAQAVYGRQGTDLHPIKQVKHVMRIIEFGGVVAVVGNGYINWLRTHENEQGVHDHKHQYELGDKIRVKSGPLKQYEGVINGLTKDERAVISLISGKNIEIPLAMLEPQAA